MENLGPERTGGMGKGKSRKTLFDVSSKHGCSGLDSSTLDALVFCHLGLRYSVSRLWVLI